jgi:hypothetical protein
MRSQNASKHIQIAERIQNLFKSKCGRPLVAFRRVSDFKRVCLRPE